MDIAKYKIQVTEEIVEPMISFMEDCGEDAEYTKKDVAKCETLILNYLSALEALAEPSDAAIMAQVKKVVLALNKLNEKTDYSLIETDAREAIWDVIQSSAIECGLQTEEEDITGEWRDW